MKLYMAVTPDRYELPIFIENSYKALERKTGIKSGNIAAYITKGKSGNRLGYKFVKVTIEEDEE